MNELPNDATSRNVFWSQGRVDPAMRARLLGQQGCVVWFTGLSGSGKSTIARLLEERLVQLGRVAYLLDGDNLRHGLNRDLTFSPEDRHENVRRIGEVAALFADAGLIAITTAISPYAKDRVAARAAAGAGRFLEVFVDVAIDVCEARDPKGLYAKARSGAIDEFTGISAPYEAPQDAELVLDAGALDPETCASRVVELLRTRGFLSLGLDAAGADSTHD